MKKKNQFIIITPPFHIIKCFKFSQNQTVLSLIKFIEKVVTHYNLKQFRFGA